MLLLYALLQSPIVPPRLPVEDAKPLVLMPSPEELAQEGGVDHGLPAQSHDNSPRSDCTRYGEAAQPWSPRYVPAAGWEDCETATWLEDRLRRQLGAMNEPPLTGAADMAGHRTRFRLLVLPSFEPAYAYRVDEGWVGRVVLHWVRLDGRGGYAPGRIAEQSSRELGTEEWARLRRAIAAARLDKLPREEHRGWTRMASGQQVLISCFDGTSYVYELLDQFGAHFFTRRCAIEEGPLQGLAEITLSLNGMRFEAE